MKNYVLIIFVSLSLFSSVTKAAVVYSYSGNNFDSVFGDITTADNLTLSFQFEDYLPNDAETDVTPLSNYTFAASAGPLNSILDENGQEYLGYFNTALLTTDVSGNITSWEIIWGLQLGAIEDAPQVLIDSIAAPGYSLDRYSYAQFGAGGRSINYISQGLTNNRGSWQVQLVSAPAAMMLVLAVCAGGMLYKRRR